MIKAAFDTSIIVRMVLGKATTLVGKLRRALEQGQFTLVLSPALVEEITETLKSPYLRAKHRWTDDTIDQFVNDLKTLATMTAGTLVLNIPQLASRDPEGIKIVAAAVEGKASFVVTQDNDLLALGEFQGVRMVEPPEFYQILRVLEAQRTSEKESTV